MEMIAFISDDSLRLVAEGAAYWQASATACPAGFEPRSLNGWIPVSERLPEPEPPPLAAPDLTPDAVAALREEWENLNKGPRQHVEIVTLPKPPEVK